MTDADSTADASTASPDWNKPARLSATLRAMKVMAHIFLRGLRNLFDGTSRIQSSNELIALPIVAEIRSPLWLDGRNDEFILRCGKVQNLRVAVKCVDGIVVKAGQLLSFWAQLGRPTTHRGYVVGREIVNGCVVPTVGGGLCQLSNALASAAVMAGIRLVERHHHSASIEGVSPMMVEDATVAWNYVDLRLMADHDFRVEAKLTHDALIVRIRARSANTASQSNRLKIERAIKLYPERPIARGCMTCDETSCFRHKSRPTPKAARTALLLNEYSPELAMWLSHQLHNPQFQNADWMLPWQRPARRKVGWLPIVRGTRGTPVIATWAGWRRTLRLHLHRGEGASRQAGRLITATELAQSYAVKLHPEHIELLISHDLLVPLWRLGTLAGRVFDVFVAELPSSLLQARLDSAANYNQRETSLVDFRIDQQWQQDEWDALLAARRCLTAHADIFESLRQASISVTRLPWLRPPVTHTYSHRTALGSPLTLTLAASALARKGANEVAAVAKKLGARVLILGSPPSDTSLWEGVNWQPRRYTDNWMLETDIVLLPAYVEHQPRAALIALANGIPVIASPACGLDAEHGLTLITPGCADTLAAAIQHTLTLNKIP
jgi:VanW like protein/Glycosyl transferases group 1